MPRKRAPRAKLTASEAADAGGALAAAVSALAARDYASAELAARLAAQGFTEQAAASALADLHARRYLDDERYAQQYVSYHAERGHGPVRIAHELRELGVDEGLIERGLTAYVEAHGAWSRLAREVCIRRFGLTRPASWAQKVKQARFLQYRGFSTDHIRSALGPEVLDEAD